MLRGTEASAPASSSSKDYLAIVGGRVNPVRIKSHRITRLSSPQLCLVYKRGPDLENAITRGIRG